jgi:hypothetical protein
MLVASLLALLTTEALVGDKNTKQSLRVSTRLIKLVATVALPGPEISNDISTTSGLAKNPYAVTISELPIVPFAPALNDEYHALFRLVYVVPEAAVPQLDDPG